MLQNFSLAVPFTQAISTYYWGTLSILPRSKILYLSLGAVELKANFARYIKAYKVVYFATSGRFYLLVCIVSRAGTVACRLDADSKKVTTLFSQTVHFPRDSKFHYGILSTSTVLVESQQVSL